MHYWFIFTSTGGMFTSHADGLTQAIAAFRRCKHPNAGEVIGVIRGAAQMQLDARAVPTPIFGVICCVAEQPDASPQKGSQ